MEAEERQKRKKEKKKSAANTPIGKPELEAQLAATVPAAPQLADFDLTADGDVRPISEATLGTDDPQQVPVLNNIPQEALEDGRALVEDVGEAVEANYAELGRSLHRLEPHFFLSKVSDYQYQYRYNVLIVERNWLFFQYRYGTVTVLIALMKIVVPVKYRR